jgi:hypothetical protein
MGDLAAHPSADMRDLIAAPDQGRDPFYDAAKKRRHRRRQNPGRGRPRQRAGGGTVARTSATQSSSGSSPEISRARALVTGAPT